MTDQSKGDFVSRFDIKDPSVKQSAKVALRAYFRPKEDITAYELAQMMPIILGLKPIFEEDWLTLGAMTRHLERIE